MSRRRRRLRPASPAAPGGAGGRGGCGWRQLSRGGGAAGRAAPRPASQPCRAWRGAVSAWLIPVLTLVVGALLSGLGTYLGLRSKIRFDYDSDLRQKRIDVYADLWRLLEPLAKYARTSPLSGSDVDALAAQIREWYFQKGGLFLSTTART